MRRVVMFAAMIGFPVAAAAQTTPPPTPVVAPLPPVAGTPAQTPRPSPAPRAVVWPPFEMAFEDAVRAADWGRLNAVAAREAMEQARDAVASTPLAPMARWDYDYQYSLNSSQSDGGYSGCVSLVSSRKYEEAIPRCDKTIAAKGTRTDAAMYWKAYAQYMLRKNDDALATIAQLRKEFPQSRYLNDAKVLENDVRRVDPATIPDPELKVLAINAMQSADPARAVPLLEGVLNTTNTLSVKRQALFVLAQSTEPRARQVLLNIAKGSGNPDLQIAAIRYLQTGKDRQATSTELKSIYESTTDLNVRRAIIEAYTDTWNTHELTMIASTSNTPMSVRTSAINGLASVGAPKDLWAIYQKETDKDLKMQMISAFGSMQALDELTQIVKNEKEPTVRARAIRALGNMKTEKTGQMLAGLYSNDQDVETKKAVISALGNQNNAEGLIAIARKETNQQMKLTIVERLSGMARSGNKAAADYMMEIIK
jgi:HEAT repeat protein